VVWPTPLPDPPIRSYFLSAAQSGEPAVKDDAYVDILVPKPSINTHH
jgi:hypothetical protein